MIGLAVIAASIIAVAAPTLLMPDATSGERMAAIVALWWAQLVVLAGVFRDRVPR